MQGVKRFTRKYIKARATKCFVDRFLEELECALPQRKDKGKAKVGGGQDATPMDSTAGRDDENQCGCFSFKE
jgi:hypothetical protein